MFEKILVANRGEIAVRVMRACREMGIRTVAVYSEADRGSLFARYADEAHLIGPAPASRSYLDIDAIIRTAIESGADAIHPGYGFLAENPRFAAACEAEGIRFIGPSAGVLELVGDKVAARRAMRASATGVTLLSKPTFSCVDPIISVPSAFWRTDELMMLRRSPPPKMDATR